MAAHDLGQSSAGTNAWPWPSAAKQVAMISGRQPGGVAVGGVQGEDLEHARLVLHDVPGNPVRIGPVRHAEGQGHQAGPVQRHLGQQFQATPVPPTDPVGEMCRTR
ncbi:hypothetical protein N8J89_24045 [Crossiella sp. CA-258035]|uniref:hypothetical protein n=1 Tax=Crossiella sp. CA-258035 TaxID=2981138 RepID=UPI0024BC9C1C|nr:hypothetical protein [Crossiella sp. CA-258035]WHT16202.1 hypothetical protein N8J89_24045 [Crossiella sp. CA-258035]